MRKGLLSMSEFPAYLDLGEIQGGKQVKRGVRIKNKKLFLALI
jgi:hypothetical protein